MTNYNRSGAGRPLAFSDQIRAEGGSLLIIGSISKDRERWTAEIVVRDGYAFGTLKDWQRIARPSFKVKLDTTDRFQVDIGTGSGVKVAFHTGSNVR